MDMAILIDRTFTTMQCIVKHAPDLYWFAFTLRKSYCCIAGRILAFSLSAISYFLRTSTFDALKEHVGTAVLNCICTVGINQHLGVAVTNNDDAVGINTVCNEVV